MRDDFHRRRELDVAAHVVAVRVRVDDHRHRLVRDGLDLVEERLAPARVLGIDDHDAGGGDEDGTVSTAAAHHEQVVFELIDLDHARRGLPRGPGLGLLQRVDGQGQRTGREQNAEHHLSFH